MTVTTVNDDFDVVRCLEVLSTRHADRCVVAPSPELSERIKVEVARLSDDERVRELTAEVRILSPKSPGLNDGLIIPGSYFPLGTSVDRVRSAAADRAPLHGTLRVIVVLVDFSDKPMTESVQHFEDLFFSTGVIGTGSVKEYFTEVTNGLVTITGEVVGPYRMPLTLAQYANGASGTGSTAPNARTMARDAATVADADVNFAPYDNDGNGFVDAFIVVHAGPGAEQTGSAGDIWSHKWVLAGGEYNTDTTKIFGYLTVPEDARLGVCAHELGHLLFGFPDLYDTDNTSEGIGNWCLMAGGSWNGATPGDTPAHPSAWCKAQQAWVTVQNVATSQTLTVQDVKDAHTVYRLWKDGTASQEYFLLENRQRDRFDQDLPGEGLLIWHIDDAIANNTDEAHYKVALEQADGQGHLEGNANRGDAGDPYPGSANNRAFTNTSTPNSKSYGGLGTCVSVTSVSDPGPVMTAQVQVSCKTVVKDTKDRKDRFKESFKDTKDRKDRKDRIKESFKESKDFRDEGFKREPDKRPEKPEIDKASGFDKPPISEKGFDKPTDGRDWRFGFGGAGGSGNDRITALEARIAALETQLGGGAPFIGEDLRPDLRDSALLDEPDVGRPTVQVDKREIDTKQSDG